MLTKAPKSATELRDEDRRYGAPGPRGTIVRLEMGKTVRANAIERAAFRQRIRLERELAKIEREHAIRAHLSESASHEVDRAKLEFAKIASQLSSNRSLMRDVELADYVDEKIKMLGRKRDGIPKSLLYEAKDKFGLLSKSAILRAYNRGKMWKANAASRGFEFGKRNPGR